MELPIRFRGECAQIATFAARGLQYETRATGATHFVGQDRDPFYVSLADMVFYVRSVTADFDTQQYASEAASPYLNGIGPRLSFHDGRVERLLRMYFFVNSLPRLTQA